MLVYTQPGLGMTVEEARQLLASGQGSAEQLREAYQVYYGTYYVQQPSVIAAQQSSEAQQYEQLYEQLQASPPEYLEMETCHPLDTPCVERNAARQQYNMALRQEWQRRINLARCLANAYQNPPGAVRDQMLASCAQYQQPVPIPAPPPSAPAVPAQPAPQPAQPSPAPAPQPATQPAPAPAAATYRPTVTLVNLSRPGAADFQVGDRFRLTITGGPPNSEVVDTATHNGRTSSTIHGRTDLAGNWSTEGVMASEHVGTWAEAWTVGGIPVSPPVISFKVFEKMQERPQPTTPQPPSQARPSPTAPGTSEPSSPRENVPTQPSGEDRISERTDTIDRIKELASSVPWYAWAAIAAGLLLLRRS